MGLICLFDNLLQKITSFKIIIYARLSKEEKDKQSFEEQSRSIRNQIEICREYVENEQLEYPNCRFEIVKELFDDGVSGTTFNRNNFNKLIKLLNEKKANMVITKDLSRLGRDHVETDNYIEKWFPEHNIRYVAILDGVDTFTDTTNNDIAPIKNWANDMYAKDTSRKIRKEFKKMMHQGKWTGGEPPIGYLIDPYNKHHFVIDEKGAEIVKRIFELALENNSIDNIANILIKDKVPIPTLIKGNKRKLNLDLIDLWSTDTIKDILKNEMYLGHMIQGKTTKLNYKSKKIIYLPEKDWIKVKNTHQPIIDKQTFETVQLLIKTNKNKTIKSHDYLLKGIMRCAECNHSIGLQHYNNRKTNYTICNYYRKYGKKKEVCTAHRFNYEELEKLVLENIKEDCLKDISINNLVSILKNRDDNSKKHIEIENEIHKCNQEIAKLKKQMDVIYEDKLNGIINIEQYKRVIRNKLDMINYNENNLKRFNQKLNDIKRKKELPKYDKIIKDFLSLNNPKKLVIIKLIDIIYIHENGTIDIHYKLQKC